MMSITRRLAPPAAHTLVREQAAQRFIPSALVGIHPLPFVNVGLALVPRNNRANSVNSIDRGGSLSVPGTRFRVNYSRSRCGSAVRARGPDR